MPYVILFQRLIQEVRYRDLTAEEKIIGILSANFASSESVDNIYIYLS